MILRKLPTLSVQKHIAVWSSVIICFIVGYLVIVLEQPLKLDKTVPAL
jgi:hypothetical protein